MVISYTHEQTKSIVKLILTGGKFRNVAQSMIDTEFMNKTIDFFKKILDAKITNNDITIDWYKKYMIEDETLDKKEIASNAGLNLKSITNNEQSSKKQVVLKASLQHYDEFKGVICNLLKEYNDDKLNVNLKITLNKITVELTLNESLIVVNALAVMRATIRGGAWSSLGKKVEKPLMRTICKLLEVPKNFYSEDVQKSTHTREVDFYLKAREKKIKIEIKLMGKGNPESADGPVARDSNLFIADKLSEKNKEFLDSKNIPWVSIHDGRILLQMTHIFEQIGVPHTKFSGNLEDKLDDILNKVFTN